MSSIGFAVRLAWRDARASRRQLALLVGAIAIGVAALVAINSFADNLRTTVATESKALLGSDLIISSRTPLDSNPVVTALTDSIVRRDPARVLTARLLEMPAMVLLPRTGHTRLVQLHGVAGGWPFHGSAKTDPGSAWSRIASGGAVVDPALLSALGGQVGDTLKIGASSFLIAGTASDVPGGIDLGNLFGSTVYLATDRIAATDLLGFGSRVEYQFAFGVPATIDVDAIARTARPDIRESGARLRTVADNRDRLTSGLGRLSDFLGLVALAALLLGGLGTASAIQVMIKRRVDSIAVLRCVGAESSQLVLTFLLQAVAMALIGSIIGALAGMALQQVLPLALAGLLPVDVQVRISAPAVALGIAMGCWTAAIFALLPLLAIRRVSPLATLRRQFTPIAGGYDRAMFIVVALLILSVVALAGIQVGSIRLGSWFAAAAAFALLILWLTSRAVIAAAGRISRLPRSYLMRQGLANLHRPANQTTTVVLAIGFGAFMLATLFVVQTNLLSGFEPDLAGDRPNLALIDIQPGQRPVVASVLARNGIAPPEFVAIIPMRLESVAGTPVEKILERRREDRDSSTGGDSRWAFQREYRSTSRAQLSGSARVVAGRWFTPDDTASGLDPARPAAISVERELAGELGIGLGSTLVWDVQGVMVHSVVTSLREVTWARFAPNFFVVFAPGSLADAPQTAVAMVQVADPERRGAVQRQLSEQTGNVISVDLGEVERRLTSLIGRIVTAIRFMALFSLATGAVVLVGAIATSRWQRIREATLLRTLGATRGQVVVILAVEYAALGLAAAVVAVVLSLGAGWALAHWLFHSGFRPPVGAAALMTAAVVILTTTIGLWSSLDVLRRPPLSVLRTD